MGCIFLWESLFLSAERSKDPHTSVGACIVSEDNKILSVGYRVDVPMMNIQDGRIPK